MTIVQLLLTCSVLSSACATEGLQAWVFRGRECPRWPGCRSIAARSNNSCSGYLQRMVTTTPTTGLEVSRPSSWNCCQLPSWASMASGSYCEVWTWVWLSAWLTTCFCCSTWPCCSRPSRNIFCAWQKTKPEDVTQWQVSPKYPVDLLRPLSRFSVQISTHRVFACLGTLLAVWFPLPVRESSSSERSRRFAAKLSRSRYQSLYSTPWLLFIAIDKYWFSCSWVIWSRLVYSRVPWVLI